jgi:hypothetical protein
MTGTRGGVARIVAMGVALALALLLLGAREATAGKYSVAQCGWYVGSDASWADTTGGVKFRPDAWCVPPAGANPFDGVHMKSFTRSGSTVSGTRFARWRWQAPPGTGITRVSGTWWHALHDGMEQRIGTATASGGFDPFASAGGTDVAPRDFVAGFSSPRPALEDRLLCARAESKWCSLEPGSWSALRALTITVQDDGAPAAGVAGGDLLAGGWRRGGQSLNYWGNDGGSGVRFGETGLSGVRVEMREHPCAKAMISGEWRATKMQPCLTGVSGSTVVDTTRFSDGTHLLGHCAHDFAGNVSCMAGREVRIDNNPPAHPRQLTIAGGEGWRRVNDFDLSWTNPDQGPASPIAAALWQIRGSAGFDSGIKLAAGRNIAVLADRSVPGSGTYTLRVWLRDEAGNDAPGSAVELPLRFDDLAPGVAFEPAAGTGVAELPETVRAEVRDAHSGAAGGEIHFRRLGSDRWLELPTKLQPGLGAGPALLTGRLPEGLAPGTYLFRADAVDGAGNRASSTRRIDGAEMVLQKPAPPLAERRAAAKAGPAAKSRLFARLHWRRRGGSQVTVPFGAGAALSGRLLDADGAGLAGRRLRIVSRPSHGALSRRRVHAVQTGPHGGFRLVLPAGPSRRITVAFRGEDGLTGSRRAALALRVRGALTLAAAPRDLVTGHSLRLWGRVRTRDAALPRRGKLVAVQYYESEARRWRPVLFVRSDHGGRFSARYRFRYVTGTATIRLRAVVLAEERWPYAPGASRPVTVRVSGPVG